MEVFKKIIEKKTCLNKDIRETIEMIVTSIVNYWNMFLQCNSSNVDSSRAMAKKWKKNQHPFIKLETFSKDLESL